MTTVWVVDIDSTIADGSHRNHLLRQSCVRCLGLAAHDFAGNCPACGCDVFTIPVSSWKQFSDPHFLALDKPIEEAQAVVQTALSKGIHVHYITGRQNNSRTVTQDWLSEHFDFDSTKQRLLMRDVDSYIDGSAHLPASQHKEIKFNQLLEIGGYTLKDSFMFFDDDIKVLEMYTKYGMTFTAPSCWSVMYHPKTVAVEKVFNK